MLLRTSPTTGRDPYKVNSLVTAHGADPRFGTIVWEPKHSLWNGGMLLVALVAGPIYFSWPALAIFLAMSGITLCAGHSVGYHRRLIHRSFECPKWLEKNLVWLGSLVGMGGPLWTIRTHDTRDWAQRQPACHDFYAHRYGILKDLWCNLHCGLILDHPPKFDPGREVASDRFYKMLERTWMLHQIPLGILLLAIGGMPCLVWGVFVRVATCTTMHWYVTRVAHTRGPQRWLVDSAGVQAHDVPWLALPTMGEAWHNNHHAFPGSARHGLYRGQLDLGFVFIRLLELGGLAWNVQTPHNLPPRNGVTECAGRDYPGEIMLPVPD